MDELRFDCRSLARAELLEDRGNMRSKGRYEDNGNIKLRGTGNSSVHYPHAGSKSNGDAVSCHFQFAFSLLFHLE